MPFIKPTIGRVVLYHGPRGVYFNNDSKAAVVAFVHSDECVNLTVFGHDGSLHAVQSVKLIQGETMPPDAYEYCHWMPYQMGQAARTEAAEGKVGYPVDRTEGMAANHAERVTPDNC